MRDTTIIIFSDGETWEGFQPDQTQVITVSEETLQRLEEGRDVSTLTDQEILSQYLLSDAIAAHPPLPFIGWEHPRYEEWKLAVANDHTVLGLSAWLEHNPEEE